MHQSNALGEWQRGVEAVAKLLDAPLWSLEQTRAALRDLGPGQLEGLAPRRAVVLDHRFALLEVIAASARSTVFAGVDLATGAPVAVKVVLPTAGFAGHRLELEREIAILSRLRHEHIVELLGHGRAGSLPYLATRRMSGGSLDAWLEGDPSLRERLAVLRDACVGIDAAARLGLAHGDLKPRNLLVSAEGRGCVCDWGSARGPDDHDELGRLGTSLFSAPERGAGAGQPTPAADVFALGLCIAFAARGWHEAPNPFARPDPSAWQTLAIRDVAPPALAELVSRCVAPDPRARPSAAAIAQALGSLSTADS